MNADVRGLLETQRKMEQVIHDLDGGPMLAAYRRATLMVQRAAKLLAPVNTGRLRASITPQVSIHGRVIRGTVGTNVKYGPFVELGTRPHWPPLSAVALWARRHGTTAFIVARAIARHGTKAHRYLQGAFDQNVTAIQSLIGNAVVSIVEK